MFLPNTTMFLFYRTVFLYNIRCDSGDKPTRSLPA